MAPLSPFGRKRRRFGDDEEEAPRRRRLRPRRAYEGDPRRGPGLRPRRAYEGDPRRGPGLRPRRAQEADPRGRTGLRPRRAQDPRLTRSGRPFAVAPNTLAACGAYTHRRGDREREGALPCPLLAPTGRRSPSRSHAVP